MTLPDLESLAPGLAQVLAPITSPVMYGRPRGVAIAFLLVVIAMLVLLSRLVARRIRYPAAVLAPAGYLALLHAIALVGLATSIRFENGIAQLTLFTFPFSMSLYQESGLPGFATGHELLDSYVRYILHFGGWNALILAVFFLLVVPGRPRSRTRQASF